MSADRLAELLHQRAQLQEHLAWLDREIAAALHQSAVPGSTTPPVPGAASATLPTAPLPAAVSGAAAPHVATTTVAAAAASILTAAGPAPAPPVPAPAAHGAAIEADAILEEYRVAPEALRTDVRKGCFLYLAAAFALLIAGVVILYFALRS